jgi:cyclophilin family peptidyl-prolyl cis-trans isomerase
LTRAIIEIEAGEIEIKLFDEETPNTVKNFVKKDSITEWGFTGSFPIS